MKKKLEDYVVVLDSYEHFKLDENMEGMSTLAILEELDKAWVLGEDTFHYADFERATRILSQRLSYALIPVLEKQFKEHINRLSDAIVELNNKFENHRHKKEPNYSEKPVY